MPDVCKMSNFPNSRYFQQYELPPDGPGNYDYDHTRCLIIEPKGTANPTEIMIETFRPSMKDLSGGTPPGYPKPMQWEQVVLENMFPLPEPNPEWAGAPRPSPFDFSLWFRSRVSIKLIGAFWRFSTKLAPLTTKHQYGSQYFDLKLHRRDGTSLVSLTQEQWEDTSPDIPCKCVSFFTQQPCRDSALPGDSPKVVHGFSLNIEIPDTLQDGTVVNILNITIDPDMENKGGNPGP